MKKCVKIFVSGRVQGVFFRAGAAQAAHRFKIAGYARNLSDGRVEVVAAGEASSVEKLIEWCRKGPPRACVESVEVEWTEEIADRYQSFDIR